MRFHAGLDLEWTVSELKDTLARIAWMDRKTERLCADLKVCALAGCLQCEDEIRAARQHLNELNVQILSDGQKDKNLVHLFRRAHQNFDCLFPAKSGEVQLKPYTHYKRYFQEPAFRTPEIHLTLDVHASYVEVSSDLTVQRVGKAGPLILDGQGHEVLEVKLNGTVLGPDAYRATQNELILLKTPSEPNFQVTVRSRIDPYSNDSMEGLYVSGGALVSQCEAVAARKIFFTIDEPANRSIITTTLIADPEKYPYRLSNGNLVADTKLEDGRCQTTWFDPHSKPSYIFGVVMGDFDVREASFTTRSGREVKLQCYSEKGKGERSEYSLWALQKSMQFDEEFYDLEYDLDTMIMVAVADFNAGAMENKGLMLFNESSLLVDSHTGTDGDFMSVATTVMHEYAHNWSGNRVTVKHFFEAALKEAFTDKRAQQFGEWLFGKDLVRPDDVAFLQDGQFPEDASADKAHPVNGDAYIDANELYDYTTYIKGRELFRLLEALLDRNGKGTFRKAQSHYFQKCDGDSVTFDQFVAAMEEGSQQDLSLYRRWFEQAGTPEVNVKLDWSKEGEVVLHLSQHCLDPRSGKEHKPFQIPFPVQLITASGKLLSPTTTLDFSDREKGTKWIVGELEERPIPVMLHDYTAPIRLNYSYTEAELVAIIRYTDDAYVRWQACHDFWKQAMEGDSLQQSTVDNVRSVLEDRGVPPLVKAHLLSLPNVRALTDGQQSCSFEAVGARRAEWTRSLAEGLGNCLKDVLASYPAPAEYRPYSEQFGEDTAVRRLRSACLGLLAECKDAGALAELEKLYTTATSFQDQMTALGILAEHPSPEKDRVLDRFAETWLNDKGVFYYWLAEQSGSRLAGPALLDALQQHPGYDGRNPNHIRGIGRGFIRNLERYHDAEGVGYRYAVDFILKIEKFNANLARGYLCEEAFIDYPRLEPRQHKMMREQLQRLALEATSSSVRAYAERVLASND